MRKFFANLYEIELPSVLQFSPIFIVSDIYHFKDSGVHIDEITSDWEGSYID